MNFFVLIQRFCDPFLLFHVIFPAIFLLYEVFVMNHVLILKKKIFSTSLAGGFFFFFFPIGINVPELLKHIQSGFLVAYSSHSRSITSSGLIFWLISQLKKSSITKEGTFQF